MSPTTRNNLKIIQFFFLFGTLRRRIRISTVFDDFSGCLTILFLCALFSYDFFIFIVQTKVDLQVDSLRKWNVGDSSLKIDLMVK